MSIFPCPWRRRSVWKPGKKCSGNCWIAANYTWSETNCRKSKPLKGPPNPSKSRCRPKSRLLKTDAEQSQKTTKLSGSLSRGFHDEIGTVRTMVVPRPSAVWISNFPSICEALVRMLRNPKPSLFSRLALEIPDPLSFT